MGFPGGSDSKESACRAGDQARSLRQEDPLEKEWQPTLVFLPGESYGQRSLVGYSPRGREELGLHFHFLSLSMAMVQGQAC